MKLEDIMVKKVITISGVETVINAARKMRVGNIGCLVVAESGIIKGIITDRDIAVGCLGAGHQTEQCHVSQHMSGPVVIADPSWDIMDASRVMTEKHVKRLPIVKNKRLIGLVSFSDIAQALNKPMHDMIAEAGASRRAVQKYT